VRLLHLPEPARVSIPQGLQFEKAAAAGEAVGLLEPSHPSYETARCDGNLRVDDDVALAVTACGLLTWGGRCGVAHSRSRFPRRLCRYPPRATHPAWHHLHGGFPSGPPSPLSLAPPVICPQMRQPRPPVSTSAQLARPQPTADRYSGAVGDGSGGPERCGGLS
jgi:hypothetical protein